MRLYLKAFSLEGLKRFDLASMTLPRHTLHNNFINLCELQLINAI